MKNIQNNWLKPQRSALIFGVFIVLFVTLLVIVEKLNGKFYTNDFEVYYLAAKDYFAGKNPYVFPYGEDTGFFKYPPTTLYFFYFATKLSFFTAQIVHVILLVIAFVMSVFILRKVLFLSKFKTVKPYNWVLYTAFFFSVIQLVREFHMGNVNLFLLCLFSLGLYALLLKKEWGTIISWGFMVILKPIVVIVFIPLFFYKKWKIIGGMFLLGIVFFLFPLFNKSINGLLESWYSWFLSVANHGTYIVSQYSLTYLASYYFGIHSNWIPSIVVLLLLLFVEFKRNKAIHYTTHSRIEFFIVLMAFTPNFFVTDTEHFLLSMPLLLLNIVYLQQLKKWYYWLLFSILLLPFTLRSNDLMTAHFSDFIAEIGLLGIVNLLAIALFYCLSFQVAKQPFKSIIK
ncbi:MAG: DUF2029 domain-containing protein [Crocinitomicaceae bacterium]|nr:DUF2029 domain-containing protein [Crocinitomicaceae bacterium]